MAPDGGALHGYTPRRDATPHQLHERQLDLRAEELRAARKPECSLVFVYDYDPVKQTVDVVLAGDRRAPPLRGIPISGAGGHGLRHIHAWKGLTQTDKPDIGYILYPRVGGGRKILDFIRRDLNDSYARIERTAIFCGGLPAAISAGETPVANVVAANPAMHQIGKDDNGIVDTTGAGFLLKVTPDGKRRVILRADEVFFLGLDQTVDDAQPVARQGDAGDGTGGAIAGGSSRVFSG